VTNGAASNLATTNNIVYTADITPAGQGLVQVNVTAGVANDAANNINIAAASVLSRTFDSVAPTVSLSSAAPDPTNSSPFSVTITFSEAVSNFVAGDISVTNGAASNLATTNNVVYTADITPSGQGLVEVNVAAGVANDAANNNNTAAASALSRTYDNVAPTVALSSAASDPTNSSPFSVTITFSEAVSNFVAGDISVTNGAASNLATTNNIVYTADITPSGQVLVQVNVAAGVANDAANNNNTAAASVLSRTYDSVAPIVSLSSAATNPTSSSPFSVTVTFSEAVSNFVAGDIDRKSVV
jgi:broad specificity phosphatase PhoE